MKRQVFSKKYAAISIATLVACATILAVHTYVQAAITSAVQPLCTGSSQYYLSVAGLTSGNSTADAIIPITSFHWTENASSATGSGTSGAGAGKVTLNDFDFSMRENAVSPVLVQDVASGKHFDSATLTLYCGDARGKTIAYYKYTFHPVLFTSFSTQGSGEVPQDDYTMAFQQIQINATGTNGSAPVTGGWNQVTNTAS